MGYALVFVAEVFGYVPKWLILCCNSGRKTFESIVERQRKLREKTGVASSHGSAGSAGVGTDTPLSIQAQELQDMHSFESPLADGTREKLTFSVNPLSSLRNKTSTGSMSQSPGSGSSAGSVVQTLEKGGEIISYSHNPLMGRTLSRTASTLLGDGVSDGDGTPDDVNPGHAQSYGVSNPLTSGKKKRGKKEYMKNAKHGGGDSRRLQREMTKKHIGVIPDTIPSTASTEANAAAAAAAVVSFRGQSSESMSSTDAYKFL